MSRRSRHGRHPHPGGSPRPRPAAGVSERPPTPDDARVPVRPAPADPPATAQPRPVAEPREDGADPHPAAAVPRPHPVARDAVGAPRTLVPVAPPAVPEPVPASPEPVPASPVPVPAALTLAGAADDRPSCTVAQLRRFIKSRPWIPLHELRRRFGIYGGDDDVSPIRVGGQVLFIGLPPAESRLMAELLDGGDVGYELSLDPGAPIVVGVYPMRPVPRG